MVADRLKEIQRMMREEGVDGWLFFDHHHRDPIAYRVLQFTPHRTPTRRWYYLIPSEGEPRALVHQIESEMLDSLPGAKITYSSWSRQTEQLKALLRECRIVAMQYSPLSAVPYVSMVDAGTIELVRSCGAEVRSAANLIQYFEARWTEEQLASHLEASVKVDEIRRQTFQEIGDRLKTTGGVTEWDIKRFVLDRFAKAKLITDHGPIVGVNANSSNPHYEPLQERHTEIKSGDFVLLDMWAKLDKPENVFYDITWTGYCGRDVPSRFENVFNVVKGARDAAVKRVQNAVSEGASIRGFEVDDAARSYIEQKGFGEHFFHRTGHSIGTEVHGTGANMDNLETHDDRKIIPFTCFSVEPGIYLEEFGIRSEVDVFVSEREARVTGESQQSLVRI